MLTRVYVGHPTGPLAGQTDTDTFTYDRNGRMLSGNGWKRCRDRSEVGFERDLQLAILGRNLHTLGRLLIAKDNADVAAGLSRRKAA